MTHICVHKLTIFGSEKGLSPERRQAVIWTNVGKFVNSRPQCVQWFPLFYRLIYCHFHKSQLSKSNFCVMCPVSSSHRRWLLRQRYICALARVSWHSHYTLSSYILMKTICCFKWLLCLYIDFHVLCQIKHFQVQVQVQVLSMCYWVFCCHGHS